MTRAAIAESAPRHLLPDRPRVVRMPSDWWDAPSVVALALTADPQPGKAAPPLHPGYAQPLGSGPAG